ncbi:hypothetical protein KSP40_PGU015329 [Platanthera guangdongensis]|uniref:Uncharacterized protein n=1 Tax=Platanthera guangdongensis TaxID=2320717 RepID=A0ABR2MM13_9ASPA
MDHASSVYKSQLAEPLPSKASHPSTKPHAQLLFLLDRASPTATPLDSGDVLKGAQPENGLDRPQKPTS